MSLKLFLEAIIKFLFGIVLVGLLIFLPAGTLSYFNGWLFMIVLFIPMLIAGIIMMIKNPKVLANRLDAKEKQKDQNLVIKFSGLMFVAGFIVAGLDYRFKWSNLSPIVTYIFFVGSFVSFFVFLAYPILIVFRIIYEEKILEKELYGYCDYKKKVEYCTIPFIW